jgi:hypothetical protein
MGGIILLWTIVTSFIREVISNSIDFLISVELRKTKIVVSAKLEDMDKTYQTISSKTGLLTNMERFSMSKKERLIVKILATKLHTNPTTEPESGVRLNPVMKDLIFNGNVDGLYKRVVKKRWSKRQKEEIRTKVVESVRENQPVWLSTLREEIAKME